MGKHFRSNGRQFFYEEEIEKSAQDEIKFLAQKFQKISGVEFCKEKSEKFCHWKTPLNDELSNFSVIYNFLKRYFHSNLISTSSFVKMVFLNDDKGELKSSALLSYIFKAAISIMFL